MKVSAKIDYACKALLELSLHYPNTTPLPLAVMAENQQIPLKFLTQILLVLKQFGYVVSVRGKQGGYLLNKLPHEILLKDVVCDFNGLTIAQGNIERDPIFAEVWRDVEDSLLEKMGSIDFEQIKVRYQQEVGNVLYVI